MSDLQDGLRGCGSDTDILCYSYVTLSAFMFLKWRSIPNEAPSRPWPYFSRFSLHIFAICSYHLCSDFLHLLLSTDTLFHRIHFQRELYCRNKWKTSVPWHEKKIILKIYTKEQNIITFWPDTVLCLRPHSLLVQDGDEQAVELC